MARRPVTIGAVLAALVIATWPAAAQEVSAIATTLAERIARQCASFTLREASEGGPNLAACRAVAREALDTLAILTPEEHEAIGQGFARAVRDSDSDTEGNPLGTNPAEAEFYMMLPASLFVRCIPGFSSSRVADMESCEPMFRLVVTAVQGMPNAVNFTTHNLCLVMQTEFGPELVAIAAGMAKRHGGGMVDTAKHLAGCAAGAGV